jgi:hypothetical protein
MSAKSTKAKSDVVSSEEIRKKLAHAADRKEKLRAAKEEEIIHMNDKITAVRAGLAEKRRREKSLIVATR